MLLSNLIFTFLLLCTFVFTTVTAQSVEHKLAAAFTAFEKDPQLRNGIASLYVVNVKSGAVVFAKNEKIGLAPASTQKIITAASAYELLGKDFRYKTKFGYSGKIKDTILEGEIIIEPAGDPTLGSWRWNSTKEEAVVGRITTAVKNIGIRRYGSLRFSGNGWNEESIPDGWIWQDIGNYYGAGAGGLNWRENQFDIVLQSKGEIGSDVVLLDWFPKSINVPVVSLVKAAAKGSGDNAYVYYSLRGLIAKIRGTIPVNENRFIISATIPYPDQTFSDLLRRSFYNKLGLDYTFEQNETKGNTFFHTETSPPLDSIIYWFNKKSINLYGEALIKTIAHQKKGTGSTNEGVALIKNLWQSKGIEKGELNMVDGSGLSPLNRVTTNAQVRLLQHAKKQAWFSGFYLSLPEYNGMKLKSGTISGVKGFCGYHTAKDGTEYAVSFLVNNYAGASSGLVMKMYKVLDVLK